MKKVFDSYLLIGFETLFQLYSRYTALDALRLISPYDEYFHCESCNGVLVAESDSFAGQELGDGDDNARRRRNEKIKDMLSKMEVCPHCLYRVFIVVQLKLLILICFHVVKKGKPRFLACESFNYCKHLDEYQLVSCYQISIFLNPIFVIYKQIFV